MSPALFAYILLIQRSEFLELHRAIVAEAGAVLFATRQIRVFHRNEASVVVAN